MHNPDTGWISLSLAFGEAEIDSLIARLRDLKSGETGHFHFRTDDFDGNKGIADIECSMMGDSDSDNMVLE